jgi:hypothetical protein
MSKYSKDTLNNCVTHRAYRPSRGAGPDEPQRMEWQACVGHEPTNPDHRLVRPRRRRALAGFHGTRHRGRWLRPPSDRRRARRHPRPRARASSRPSLRRGHPPRRDLPRPVGRTEPGALLVHQRRCAAQRAGGRGRLSATPLGRVREQPGGLRSAGQPPRRRGLPGSPGERLRALEGRGRGLDRVGPWRGSAGLHHPTVERVRRGDGPRRSRGPRLLPRAPWRASRCGSTAPTIPSTSPTSTTSREASSA